MLKKHTYDTIPYKMTDLDHCYIQTPVAMLDNKAFNDHKNISCPQSGAMTYTTCIMQPLCKTHVIQLYIALCADCMGGRDLYAAATRDWPNEPAFRHLSKTRLGVISG